MASTEASDVDSASFGVGLGRSTIGRGLVATDEPFHAHTTVTFDRVAEKRKTTASDFAANPKFRRMREGLQVRATELADMVVTEARHGAYYLNKATAETNLKQYLQLFMAECLPEVTADYTEVLSSTPPADFDLSQYTRRSCMFWRSATEFLAVERSGRQKNVEQTQSLRNRVSTSHALVSLFQAYRAISGLKVHKAIQEECFALSLRLCSNHVRVKSTATWSDVSRIVHLCFDHKLPSSSTGSLALWRSGLERLVFVTLLLLLTLTGARPGEVIQGQHQADYLKFKDLTWCWERIKDRDEIVLTVDVEFRLLKGMRANPNAFRIQPLYSTGKVPLAVDIGRHLTTLAKRAGVFPADYDFDAAEKAARRIILRDGKDLIEIPTTERTRELPVFPRLCSRGSKTASVDTSPLTYDQALPLLEKVNKYAGVELSTMYSFRRCTVDSLNSCRTVREVDMQTSVGHRPGSDATIRNYISRRNTVDVASTVMDGVEAEAVVQTRGLRFIERVEPTDAEKQEICATNARIQEDLNRVKELRMEVANASSAFKAAASALETAEREEQVLDAQQRHVDSKSRLASARRARNNATLALSDTKRFFFKRKSQELTAAAHEEKIRAVGALPMEVDASSSTLQQETHASIQAQRHIDDAASKTQQDDAKLADQFQKRVEQQQQRDQDAAEQQQQWDQDAAELLQELEDILESMEAAERTDERDADRDAERDADSDADSDAERDAGETGDISRDGEKSSFHLSNMDFDAFLFFGADQEDAYFAGGGTEEMLADWDAEFQPFRDMMRERFAETNV